MNNDAPVPRFDSSLAIFLGDLRSWVFTSQSQAARHFGLKHTTISRYENGHLRPPIGYLACLVQLFDARLTSAQASADEHRALFLREVNRAIRAHYPHVAPLQNWEELCRTAAAHLALQEPSSVAARVEHRVDWGEAPDVSAFFGRAEELELLKQWLVVDRCRLVAVLGIGGVGKTALVAKLAEQLQDEFEYVIWRSLRNAPLISETQRGYWQVLSYRVDEQETPAFEADTSRLIKFLTEHRCLLILDNVESIIRPGEEVGHYIEGYELYGEFFRRIGESRHQSCLVLTGREKPGEFDLWTGNRGPVRFLQLSGVAPAEALALLEDRGLNGSPASWQSLVTAYAGNPLRLKLVAETINEIFDGDIARFLSDGRLVSSGIRRLLEQQFARLSPFELELIYWLAVAREPLTADALRHDLVQPPSGVTLVNALHSLRRRSLVEKSGVRFTLQDVVAEYATDQFITRICSEIMAERVGLLQRIAWLKAEAREDVRQIQRRLILEMIVRQLAATLGLDGLVNKIKQLLAGLRAEAHITKGYGAGNLLNLLIYLRQDLRGLDFSNLAVWQADLREALLPEVNFTHADLSNSVFRNTFTGVNAVAISPDGKLLAIATGYEVRVWTVDTNQLLTVLAGHTDLVWTVAFDPSGEMLASGSADRTVRLWHVRQSRLISTFHGHAHWIWAVAFNHDGTLLASGGEDHTIRLWNLQSNENAGLLQAHTGPVRAVAFNPQGGTLASGSADLSVCVWDLNEQQVRYVLRGHSGPVMAVSFSPDGGALATGGDQSVRVWNLKNGNVQHLWLGHTGTVASVAFSPDGDSVASGSYDHVVYIWSLRSPQAHRLLSGHRQPVRSVAYDASGELLVTGSYDHSVRFWETRTGQLIYVLRGYTYEIKAVAMSADGTQIASGDAAHEVRVWNRLTGALTHTLSGHARWIAAVAFYPAGNLLASGSYDRTARIWDLASGEVRAVLRDHTDWVWCVAFSPDGTRLATGSADTLIHLWDVASGERTVTLAGHAHGVSALAFSPTAPIIASGSEDRTVRLWDATSGRVLHTLAGHAGLVATLAFSPSGKLLASGDKDGGVWVWEVATGALCRQFTVAGGTISALAFGDDETVLMRGSDAHLIQKWRIPDETPLLTINMPEALISAVSFSADHTSLVSGGFDGTLKVWAVANGELLQTLRIARPYDGMKITGVVGVTEAQKVSLKVLGATE